MQSKKRGGGSGANNYMQIFTVNCYVRVMQTYKRTRKCLFQPLLFLNINNYIYK